MMDKEYKEYVEKETDRIIKEISEPYIEALLRIKHLVITTNFGETGKIYNKIVEIVDNTVEDYTENVDNSVNIHEQEPYSLQKLSKISEKSSVAIMKLQQMDRSDVYDYAMQISDRIKKGKS